jgi:hypothetical protein
MAEENGFERQPYAYELRVVAGLRQWSQWSERVDTALLDRLA